MKPRVDDKEEKVQVKRRDPYGTKKCGCPFKLKGEQMVMCENWQLFVHDGRHNHAIGVYKHGHAQAAKLTDEQLIKTEQFRKSHVLPRNILQFFREQNMGCAISAISIENQQDLNAHELKITITDRESGLTPVIDDKAHRSECIGQINRVDKRLRGAITEYLRKLDVLKTKWQKMTDFLHYLFTTWLNPLAHKEFGQV
ncbi:hypothetical protein M9H77_26473 [Catharanthus roseus]|uniref:Uncharacterized protein n=1 Tax=Catharanthus roseus TaxID=4058 RepID=A0ACC0ABM2_CATRO|nr:hypothetical protein M9H77_26473 [Catharanthus roseus]